MSVANIPNYRDQIGAVDMPGDDPDQYLLIYNDSGAALAEGACYFVTFIPSGTAGKWPTVTTPATSAVRQVVGVVNNWLFGSATIADKSWGYVQTRGYCSKVLMTAGLADQEFLQCADSSTTAVDDGTTMTSDSFAIVITTDYVTNNGYSDCWILGREVIIG
jgi:hypothetical protein